MTKWQFRREVEDSMEKALMNIKEFCEYLSIGETKARELLKSQKCNFSLKIGNRWYINKRLLDIWLDKKTKEIERWK